MREGAGLRAQDAGQRTWGLGSPPWRARTQSSPPRRGTSLPRALSLAPCVLRPPMKPPFPDSYRDLPGKRNPIDENPAKFKRPTPGPSGGGEP